jgi:tungstate transport system substrate-binding protein
MIAERKSYRATGRSSLKTVGHSSAAIWRKKFIIFSTTLILLLLIASMASLASETVRLSSTIGPIDAGIVPVLAQAYEKKTGVRVEFVGAGTGLTLERAKTGDYDLVMVHARKLEEQFIKDGFGVTRRDVFFNDFVILGPKSDPAGIRGMPEAAKAFAQIAKTEAPFITRGDRSGTHVKEVEVWEVSGIKPQGAWYHVYEKGSEGNRSTTLFVNEKQGYVLMDRATYLILKKDITLEVMVEKDPILLNYIAVIDVNPQRFPDVNAEGARKFIEWLCSLEAQEIIRTFKVEVYGEPLFFPNSEEWHKANPRAK